MITRLGKCLPTHQVGHVLGRSPHLLPLTNPHQLGAGFAFCRPLLHSRLRIPESVDSSKPSLARVLHPSLEPALVRDVPQTLVLGRGESELHHTSASAMQQENKRKKGGLS